MRSSDGLPTVAIVGRPNVGKSTFFNRVLKRRQAVVHDEAGVTRDRNYARARYGDREFWLVDTGGFTLWDGRGIELQIQQQVEAAIQEADLVLLLLDAGSGLSDQDEKVVRTLLKQRKPVVCAANKADNEAREIQAMAIVAGGLDEVIPVSAKTGRGMARLLDALIGRLPAAAPLPPLAEDVTALAIIGRPNVGKSSLVNAILGENKMVVDSTAGTTRDSIDTPVELNGSRFLLIDTAGLRRRSKVRESVEFWSTIRSSQAL
ncbi:MAG TPA: ribosome biogenesis GTPase Der, partial [bacterium]|nr:ribosome biogenesis GTPase Der [bacterium]